MSRIALPVLPMLIALSACAPAADSAAESAEVVAAAESESTPEATPDDMPAAPDAGGADTSAEGSEGGTPPPGNPPAPEVIAGPGLDESCDASKVQDVVGKKPEQALVDDAVRRSGAKAVRVIPHDGMVTMDYRGDRLNLQLDASGTIVTATCG